MKNLSDEELLNEHVNRFVGNGNGEYWVTEPKLLSRLARGRKAIEFVEALIKHRDNGVDLEAEGRIYLWIDEYQQSCKEAADGN